MADPIADTSRAISRSSFAFLTGTVLSRLTGFCRDVAMAYYFGSSASIAAFMVAFRFANLIRRLFGEGPLPSSFIPYFEQMRALSDEKGAQFFRDLLSSAALLLVGVIALIEVGMLALWKWGCLAPENAQVLHLTILMLPGVLFICLFGLSSGLLQCDGKFFLTGFAPVGFNLVWIITAWTQREKEPQLASIALAGGVVIAFLMQWVVLLPKTIALLRRSLSWKSCFNPRLFASEMCVVVKPFLFGIIGVGAVQINAAVDAVLARYVSLEGPAYLWYAIRIEQLPLALFGIAISSALLPPLSRAIKDGFLERFQSLLQFAYRRSFSLIFPCTVGIFVVGASGLNLAYGRGSFEEKAICETLLCLWGYGLGLIPAVFVLLMAPAFYAKKDFRTPTFGAVYAVIFNLLATSCLVFIFNWGAFSIAVATSIAAWVNYFYLSYHLRKDVGSIWDKPLVVSLIKTGCCALIAGGVTLSVGHYLIQDPTIALVAGSKDIVFVRGFSEQFFRFLAIAGTFGVVFLSYARLIKADDLLDLFEN
jgi:putative peptidoglycan lipid II flippase